MILKTGRKFLIRIHFDFSKLNFLILMKLKILGKHVLKDQMWEEFHCFEKKNGEI